MQPLPLKPLSDMPTFSVLIANYNYAAYVGRAIESILSQTYQNFEIIVCDDGSKDNSLDVINYYSEKDERIKVIMKENAGQASALNAAFRISKGDIITFLDADDLWFPNRLAIVRDTFLKDQRIGFVYHRLKVVDQGGKLIRVYPKSNALADGWFLCQLNHKWHFPLAPSSALSLHRSIAEHVFPLPEKFRAIADTVVKHRALAISFIRPIQEPLGIWQQHSQNTTGYAQFRNIEAIERSLNLTKYALDDMIEFINKHYPDFKIDYNFFERNFLGFTKCLYALYSGKTMSWSELKLYKDGYRLLLWYILFKLPFRLGSKIHQFWLRNAKLHAILSRY